MPIRDKVNSQIKKALERFRKAPGPVQRTTPIHKKSMKKKRMQPRENFYQQQARTSTLQHHVLNFYNMIAINQRGLRNVNHDESFIKSYFYHKNLKRVEATEHYLLIHLSDHHARTSPVPETIARYKNDPDPRFQTLATLLEEIERRTSYNRPDSVRASSLSVEATAFLQSLGHSAYICKISSNRLVVSKALMEMLGYESEDFVIQCLKFRMPLFEGFACEGYFELIVKILQKIMLMLDYLDGRIPLATFSEINCHRYQTIIRSKRNLQYHCDMSLSMPIPLISLIKVQKVLETSETWDYDNLMLHSREFKNYATKIREREYSTLQHLVWLPENSLPSNKLKVAGYLDRNVSDEEISKSIQTE